MAFDRPLEADRVDNLGLLSSFVRAPIVGPIMWMFGKNLIDKDDKENQLFPTTDNARRSSCATEDESFPDMSNSTISDIINDSSLDDYECSCNDTDQSSISSSTHTRRNIINYSTEESKVNEVVNSFQRKKSRKMSWSDESGASLVEYCDMVSQ
jgi:hypothetical protein